MILVDDSLSSPDGTVPLLSGIEREVTDAGLMPVVIRYNSGPGLLERISSDPGREYGPLEDALQAIKWLGSRMKPAFIAIHSETYEQVLDNESLHQPEMLWIPPHMDHRPDIQKVIVPSITYQDQVIKVDYKIAAPAGSYTLKLLVDGEIRGEKALEPGGTKDPIKAFNLKIGATGNHLVKFQIVDISGRVVAQETRDLLVVEKPEITYISTFSDISPLLGWLRSSDFKVRVVSPTELLGWKNNPPDSFGPGKMIILDSVPANYLPPAVSEILDNLVSQKGASLLMVTGGQLTIESKSTAVEDLLPVKFGQNKKDEVKNFALVAVVDASFSMYFKVAGSGPTFHSGEKSSWGLKMKMAKKALMNLSDALDDDDHFGVLAVKDYPSWIVKPQLPRNRADELELIGGIKARGAGINLYSGLYESFRSLTEIEADAKHILVFLDTADVDEYQVKSVGTVWELIKDLNQEGITVSLIGFGHRKDEHIPELSRLADESGGYFYLTSDITQIPGFSMEDLENVSESLVSFKHRKVRHFSKDFPGMEDFPNVRGQAISTLKPGASLHAWTDRGYPLYATWSYGRGSVGVFTADSGHSLARDWVSTGDRSAWEPIVARLSAGSHQRPKIYLSNHRDGVKFLYRWIGSRGIPPSGKAYMRNGAAVDIQLTELAPQLFMALLPSDYGQFQSLEIHAPETDAAVLDQILLSEKYVDEKGLKGNIGSFFEHNFSESRREKKPEPIILRLLILLVITLVVLNELSRPPSREEE
jgi:hypothetical protein